MLFSGALQYGQPHCSVTRIGPITRPDRESAVKSFPEVAADKPQKKIAHLEGGRPPQLAASFIYRPSARDGCIWKSKIHSGHRVVTTVVSRPVRARSSLVRSIIWKNCLGSFWLISGTEILTIANRLSIGAGGECGLALNLPTPFPRPGGPALGPAKQIYCLGRSRGANCWRCNGIPRVAELGSPIEVW